MQRALSILLMCGILGQAFVRTAWTLHYQWNRATYIAHCENKDKPKLHCDGQCGFMKQIAAREQSKNKAPQLPDNFRELKDIQLFFETQPVPCIRACEFWLAVALPPYLATQPDAPLADIFRPPA